MSRKIQTTTTKKEAKSAMVPKLRFPEFRGTKAWASEPMGEIYSFKGNNSLSRDKLNYVGGSVRNIHYGDIHTKFSSHFDITKELVPFINESEESIVRDENLCAEGDMIFADASEDMADIGKSIEIVSLNGERVVSGLHTILARRTGGRIALGFGGHLFKSGWVRTQIQKEAQGAKVLGISANRMRNIRLPLPHAKAEQQKIAECLSSVDELTAAQARKVDALKTHKKGLMQQLFPREGETQPRLRFPEFQNAGEWEDKAFSELCDITPGYAFESEFFSNEGDYVLLTPGNFYEEGDYRDRGEKQKYYSGEILRDYVLAEGDMLVAMTEQAAGLLGSPIIVPESDMFLHNQRLGLVTKRPGVAWTNEFFFHVFNTQPVRKAIHDTASGAKVRHTSPTKIGDVVVSAPATLPEQQRIADCLTSLDDLIAGQTQKHEALKTHKKGLMQQLFPSPEEVEG